VRAARTEGRQERRARRNRELALIVAEIFFRLAGAIMLETLAFAAWNIGTRSPTAAVRDMVKAARNLRVLASGVAAFVVGLIFIVAATVLLIPAVYPVDLVPIAIGILLVALVLELLIGNDLRLLAALLGGRSGSANPRA
jgi:hypothetical protein